VTQAAIETARSGLAFAIVCTGTESPALLQKLNDENIKYTQIDARSKR
jgi:predicted transcriptional regulator